MTFPPLNINCATRVSVEAFVVNVNATVYSMDSPRRAEGSPGARASRERRPRTAGIARYIGFQKNGVGVVSTARGAWVPTEAVTCTPGADAVKLRANDEMPGCAAR